MLMTEECRHAVLRISLQQRAFIERVKNHPALSNARCLGTIAAIDLNVEDAGYASSIRKRILDFFLSKGILLRPLGNVLYILPPYCISEEELETVHQAIIEFLHEL
jgi:adenosylmethionine-8-amino-7-oxononanoate aminotransferase